MASTSWYKSKTLWFNIITQGMWVIQEFAGAELVSPTTALMVITLGNAGLRLITKEPIGSVK